MSKVTDMKRKEPVVWQNDAYRITVGPSEMRQPSSAVVNKDQVVVEDIPTVYKIINNTWNVVEDEQTRLPQAMYSVGLLELQMQQAGWEAALQEYERANSPLALPGAGSSAKVINPK